ncbi:hypothetical protein HPP92_018910 [Vanilla planifolia]|uniref:Phosphofructokinase domain-containing protein n=1 Tax=Vanilla planifolia TaxID=51239 RepID=A0A835Q6K9_VANPL|nr:hypothetical protein HPP92_018910 [Vanilla planifolia]
MDLGENPNSRHSTFSLPPFELRSIPYLSETNPDLPSLPNPISQSPYYSPSPGFYLSSSDVILRHILFDLSSPPAPPLVAFLRAGPRRTIRFDTYEVCAAIVTCGGLCPGINTVVRELVVGLWEIYGVRRIYGVPSGYRGFYSAEHWPLEPRVYCIGGDGTMRGAAKIFGEIRRRRLRVCITGIPKTVDNDIGIIDRSFGFQTAVEMALQAVHAARVEAESAVNGIGLVKLMGRSTGHIALHATLSSRDVDCCLIPETDFYLEGKGGLFEFLDGRLRSNGHAVVVVAEGAGQRLIPRVESEQRDESGNPAFLDVGSWLKEEMKRWRERDHPGELFTVKYIDPTYMIRAVPANAADNLYCTLLAHSSIHGAMAGFTGFVSGPVNGNYAYVSLEEVAEAKSVVDTKDHKWAWVRSVTNQPDFGKT